jgi:hypothetical protein
MLIEWRGLALMREASRVDCDDPGAVFDIDDPAALEGYWTVIREVKPAAMVVMRPMM